MSTIPPLKIRATADVSAAQAALNSLRNTVSAVATKAKTATSSFTGLMSNMGGQGRFIINNTANQLGDMAVQLSMGTSAMRVMGFQLPQLFGGFAVLGGALGSVMPMLGALAAIGFPIAAAFLAMGSNSAQAGANVQDLASAVAAYETAAKRAAMTSGELVAEFGLLSDEARSAFTMLAELQKLRAFDALKADTEALADKFSDLIDIPPLLFDAYSQSLMGLGELTRSQKRIIENLEEEFGMAFGHAEILTHMLSRMSDMSSLDEIVENTQQWSDLLLEVFGSAEDIPQPLREVLTKLQENAVEALRLRAALDTAASSARELSASLPGNGVAGGRGGDPRQFETDKYWKDKFFPDPVNSWQPPKTAGSSGRATAAIKETTKATSELTTEQRRLQAQANATASALKRGFDEGTTVIDKFKMAVLRAVEALADMFLQQQIIGAYNSQTGQGNGVMKFLGDLFFNGSHAPSSSPIPTPRPFDGGGFTGIGARSGGIDGRGGFPAILHPNETVIDHTRGQSAGGVNQTFHMTINPGRDPVDGNRIMMEIRAVTKHTMLEAMRSGGAYRQAFGR